MTERTLSGDGVRFASDGSGRKVRLKSPYSERYAQSLNFKAAGKSKNEVNMQLTGDMLASVDVLSVSGNKIRIGITDETNVLKAFNHITGDTVPSRPWFGVTKGELKEIAEKFKPDIEEIVRSQRFVADTESDALTILDRLNNFGGDDEL